MSFRKGRRLKRYLGLKRKIINPIGALEIITPSYISGWAALKDEQISEVCLYVGNNLISRAPVNLIRKDVTASIPFAKNPGFKIYFPRDFPPIDLEVEIKLIAKNKGVGIAPINMLGGKKKCNEILKKIFKSNLLGVDGNVDGIKDDLRIYGWARRANFKGPLKIWMSCESFDPIEVFCNLYRDDFKVDEQFKNCGFKIDPDKIPENWASKNIKFYFDKELVFPLPQNENIALNFKNENDSLNFENINDYNPLSSKEKIKAPKELQKHWKNLEQFNLFLNSLDDEIK